MFGRRKRDLMPPPGPYSSVVPTPFSELIPQGPATELERLARRTPMPDDARRLLLVLDTEVTQASQYIAANGLRGTVAYEIEQIRDHHGPEVVRRYAALPPGTQATVALTDGRTGDELLIEDLSVLIEAVRQQMAVAAEGLQTAALITDRFLQDKYGQQPPSL